MQTLRPDRLLTLCLFQPLRRMIRLRGLRIPILMYHSVSDDRELGRGAYYRIATHPTVFREQMAYLARSGYRVIGLNDAVRTLAQKPTAVEKVVVLTFDDGYQDFYTQALPVLTELRLSATVFLPTAYVGNSPRIFNGRECLTWRRVRELHNAGIAFGSHTVTHPQLAQLTEADVTKELQSSRKEIENQLGSPVTLFSYPYSFPEAKGYFRRRLRAILAEAGYEVGVSTMVGTASSRSDKMFLERLPINSTDDLALFRAKLEGGYNWVHTAQRTYKALKEWSPLPRRDRPTQ